MGPDTVIIILVIILSVIIHEVMHGVAADKLGDPTARLAGRLTLNPLPHIDPIGSILLPIIFALTPGSFFFGWAKPVPYNPYNLRPGRFSEAIVAGAGPAANLAIAIVFALALRSGVFAGLESLFIYIVAINISLMLLNLIPVPPLDGSKIASAILPRALSRGYENLRAQFEHNPFLGFGVVLVIILLFSNAYTGLVFSITRLLAGM